MENKIIKEIKELNVKEENKANLSRTDQDQDAVETIIKKDSIQLNCLYL